MANYRGNMTIYVLKSPKKKHQKVQKIIKATLSILCDPPPLGLIHIFKINNIHIKQFFFIHIRQTPPPFIFLYSKHELILLPEATKLYAREILTVIVRWPY